MKTTRIFDYTNKQVKHWQKHRIKTSVLEQLKNWQNIETNLNLNNGLISDAEKQRKKAYNSLIKNYFFIMGKTIELKQFFNNEKRAAKVSEKSNLKILECTVNNLLFEYSDTLKNETVIRREQYTIKNGKMYHFSFELKDGVITEKTRLQDIAENDTVLTIGATKKVSDETNKSVATKLAENTDTDVNLWLDIDFTDYLNAKTDTEKNAILVELIAQSKHFTELSTVINAAAKNAESKREKENAANNALKDSCEKNHVELSTVKELAKLFDCDNFAAVGKAVECAKNAITVDEISEKVNDYAGIDISLIFNAILASKQFNLPFATFAQNFAPKK